MRIARISTPLLLAFCFFVSAPLAHAQLAQKVGGGIEIRTSPEYPSAYEEVTVSVEAFGLNTTGGSINWTRNGVAVVDAKNARSFHFTTGGLGTRERIGVTVTPVGKAALFKEFVLIPSDVDLILEPDTYVPTGYAGRALPSFGAHIRAVAVPHLFEAGAAVAPNDIVYTWSMNGKVLEGGPVLGRQDIDITLPMYGETVISVRAASKDSIVKTERAETLHANAPKIVFYEETALSGRDPLSYINFLLPKSETSLRAEPYFLDTALKNDPSFKYQWTIDGKNAVSDPSDPFLMTIGTGNGGLGNANGGFSIRSLEHVLQSAQASFSVQFTGAGFTKP